MRNNRILESLGRLGVFVSGAVGYHFVDKVLTYDENSKEVVKQEIRDEILNKAVKDANEFFGFARNQFKLIHEAVEQSSQGKNSVVSGGDSVVLNKNIILETVKGVQKENERIISKLSKLDISDWDKSSVDENLKNINNELNKIIDIVINSDKQKFLGFNFSEFYDYLDGLTILQESSLLHIMMFLVILITIINILSVLFGNEIIRFFNLEQRFPKLAIFFNLRSKLQKYYLIWNVLILFVFCIFGIFINILVFNLN